MIAGRKIRFVNLLYLHVFRLRESGEETNPRVRVPFSPNSGGMNFNTVHCVIIKH